MMPESSSSTYTLHFRSNKALVMEGGYEIGLDPCLLSRGGDASTGIPFFISQNIILFLWRWRS